MAAAVEADDDDAEGRGPSVLHGYSGPGRWPTTRISSPTFAPAMTITLSRAANRRSIELGPPVPNPRSPRACRALAPRYASARIGLVQARVRTKPTRARSPSTAPLVGRVRWRGGSQTQEWRPWNLVVSALGLG